MALTVHHYFPRNSSNVGDTLVAHAIQKALGKHLGMIQWVNLPVNERFEAGVPTGLRDSNLKRTNEEADMVVVGGSNLLEPRKPSKMVQPDKPGWGVATSVESLQQLQVPMLLIGMGTGSDWGQPIRQYTPQAKLEVQWLHEKAFACAVRDMPTQQQLAQIGIEAECTGCPVTFLTDRPVTAHKDAGPLLVSLPPARLLKSWSGKRFMASAMQYLHWLMKENVDFIVTLHERADLDFASQWVPAGIERFYTEDVDTLIARYEQSRGTIGFRLHAALLSLGLGKPIVPVNVDWRGRAFTHTFGLQDLALEPNKWGQFQQLKEHTQQLLQNDSRLIDRLAQQKQKFMQQFNSFLNHATMTYLQIQRKPTRLAG
ncbi:MAG: polysaccharide pyruvyl transferase family protein [Planctomycetia bacterium]|nr:polysaccharide pyruvyl transferase family protein [Planctomycetia bacterium]